MIEDLIQYVMERANQCYADDFPINQIEEWIREFFKSYKKTECRWIIKSDVPEIPYAFKKDMLTRNKPIGLTGLKIDHKP